MQELEDFYADVHGGFEVQFPSNYPTSALVGCVNVVDVLTVCPLEACSPASISPGQAFACLWLHYIAGGDSTVLSETFQDNSLLSACTQKKHGEAVIMKHP